MRNEDDCSGLVLGLFIASIFCLCPFSISGKADYAGSVRHAYTEISPRSEVFGYGDPVGNPLKSHTHFPTAYVYHLFTWLISDYWQPGALLVFTGTLVLLSLRNQRSKSGSYLL